MAREPGIKPFDTVTLDKLLDGQTKIEWLVEPLIPPRASGALIGDGGVGKSWMTLELILSVASGRPWLGRFKTRKGPVLVVDEENAGMLLRIRLRKLIKGHGIDTAQLSPIHFMVGNCINLTPERTPSGELRPSQTYRRLFETVKAVKPALITFDSLTRVHTSNENASHEMSSIFRQVKQITERFGCSTWFTHHTNKRGSYRGSTDIRNFVDYALTVDKLNNGLLRVDHNKSRWEELVSAFTVRWCSHEKDDALTLTYAGKASGGKDGQRKVWDFISTELAENGKLPRKKLVACGSKAGFCESAIDKELRRAKEHEPPLIETTRVGRQAFYSLANNSSEPSG